MRRFRLPPQILRLVLLTLAIVGSYLVARAFLAPPSFGQYGWYRGAALAEIASRPPVFAGKKACDECHSDILHKLAADAHKTLSCEACHGVSREHARQPGHPAGQGDRQLLHPVPRSQSGPPGLVQANRRQRSLRRKVHRLPPAASTQPKPMKTQFSRRSALARLGGASGGRAHAVRRAHRQGGGAKCIRFLRRAQGLRPDRSINGSCALTTTSASAAGLCAEACKKENGVPEGPYLPHLD